MFFSKKEITKPAKNEFVKESFSQTGEDLIVRFILEYQLGITDIYYLDIGAYQPYFLSNTALFNEIGYSGVCIEPNPELCGDLENHRPNCQVVNVGVGSVSSESDFYVLQPGTLSTFSEIDARKYELIPNVKIKEKIRIPILTVNQIIKEKCNQTPNFVSIDVEGLDLEIVKSFDFGKYRPAVFCIETLEYTSNKDPKKSDQLIEYMLSKNYFIYADTFINTIFVDKVLWDSRNVAL